MYSFGKAIILVALAMGFGYYLNEYQHPVLNDFSEIRESDVIGFLGTIYALITAFTLVNVWNHFDFTRQCYADENDALIAIWVNTDYLDDPMITELMKKVLLNYIDRTLVYEFPELSGHREISLPSTELIEIKKVIDKIQFNDSRDPVGFEQLIVSYRNLTKARNQRIEQAVIDIPRLLRYFYLLTSIIFWIGFLIQGFSSPKLYYIVLFMGTLIVVFSYTIIIDLDNPLGGLLRQPIRKYEVSKEFIETTDHEISVPITDNTYNYENQNTQSQ